MSTRNVKTLPPQQATQPTEAPPVAAPSDMAPAVVSAPAGAAPANDYSGQGGLYTMKDGRRVLIQKTQPVTPEPTATTQERT